MNGERLGNRGDQEGFKVGRGRADNTGGEIYLCHW